MMTEKRADDSRMEQMVQDINQLKWQMVENTVVTTEVRDLLAGIKLLLSASKWTLAVAASLAAIWAAIKGLKL